MHFVPSPALLKKLIIRATQIDPLMIDFMLNPRDLNWHDLSQAPLLDEIKRKCPNYPSQIKLLKMEHIGFTYPDLRNAP